MSHVHVLHENHEWTRPLLEELDALGVPYRDWFLDEGQISIDEPPPEGVFYNRMSASSHTRGHRYAPEHTGLVLAWLESYGRRVFNRGRALQLEISKIAQYGALRRHGIPTPRTVAAVGRSAIVQAARAFDGPFITKHNRGGKGLGVHLFRSLDALERHVSGPEFEPPIDGVTLIQEYIEAPEPFIVRCEYVGGEFLYAVRVDTSDGFQLCPADDCAPGDLFCPAPSTAAKRRRFEILRDFAHPLLERIPGFLADNGIHVAGIELITDGHGRAFAYDVNTNTNYNAEAEERAGTPRLGMQTIARLLGRALEAETRAGQADRSHAAAS